MSGPDNSGKESTSGALPVNQFLQRPLWYWPELAEALGTPAAAGGPNVTGISIDTRSLNSGDLFIALAGDPGTRFFTSSPGSRDGHEFLTKAQAKGAAGAIVSESAASGLPQLRVADTLDGLWALGRAAVQRHRGVRIAITGSSGKTTAKAFMAAALAAEAEPGSLNNFWGVPLCLARTPMDAPHGIYEIGTNQPGEIAPLSQLVKPDVAIVLNVHPAHLGNFPSFEALQEEKISISKGLDSLSNLVCEYSVAQAAGLTRDVLTFGDQPGCSVRLLSQRAESASIETPAGVLEVQVPGGGYHRALTLTAVVATLVCLGEDPRRASQLPSTLVPKGRGNERLVRRADGGEWVLIDDSYNANPASMEAALSSLSDSEDKVPSYAIIGEMLELGERSESYHLALLQACQSLAGVYCVGAGTKVLFDALPPELQLGYADEASAIDLRALLPTLPGSGRLLVKGSNRVFWQHDFCASLARQIEAHPV